MRAQVDDATLEVTELPVRKWTQDYKEFLEGLIKPEGDKAGPPILADYREHHSDADVHFSLQLLPGQMGPALAAGLHAKFKLTTKISCGAPRMPSFCACYLPSSMHACLLQYFCSPVHQALLRCCACLLRCMPCLLQHVGSLACEATCSAWSACACPSSISLLWHDDLQSRPEKACQ